MKLSKLIAVFCAITVLITSIAVYAEDSNDSGTTITLGKTETISCGSITAAGQFNPVIDVSVDTGNGGVAVKVLKNTAVVWKQFVPEGKTVTIDLTIDAVIGDKIEFTMTPEEGKTPTATYNYRFGDKYSPINTGKSPQNDGCIVKSQKSLGQYIADAADGEVYVMYNYKRIPMNGSGSEWSANPLTVHNTGTLGDLNDRPAAYTRLNATTATLGAYGGTPSIDIPITEDGLMKISGAVPGIDVTEDGVYKGVVTNIYKNGEKIWSSRVGDYSSVRYDEGYKNSCFNEEIDVVTKVKVGDIITFSFDSWHAKYGNSYYVNLSDVSLAYIEGDPMGESAKWFFKNSDVYDAERQLLFQEGALLFSGDTVQRVDMILQDGEVYIAADEIGKSVSFAKIPVKEETRREDFDYPDSGTGLKETYKPFYISTPIGQVKDHSIAYIGTVTNPTAQFIMNAEEFDGSSNPLSDGIVTFEFRCKGDTGGDVTILFGRGEGSGSWWENGITDGANSKAFKLHNDFSCEPINGTKVTPTYTYSDGWYRVKVEVDVASKAAYMSVNDAKTSALELPAEWDLKNLFRIQLRKGMTTGQSFYVDDAKITYTEDAVENGTWVECITKNSKTYYNICDLISANGRSAVVVDGRFVVAFEGIKTQISYSELSQIAASLSDDAILTEYGTKVDFNNLLSRLRVNVRLFEPATADKETTVILAGYKDGALVYADMRNYSVLAGEDLVEEFYTIDNSLDYDTISVFVWRGGGSDMVPEANAGTVEK